jgi:hypothetical protein
MPADHCRLRTAQTITTVAVPAMTQRLDTAAAPRNRVAAAVAN